MPKKKKKKKNQTHLRKNPFNPLRNNSNEYMRILIFV